MLFLSLSFYFCHSNYLFFFLSRKELEKCLIVSPTFSLCHYLAKRSFLSFFVIYMLSLEEKNHNNISIFLPFSMSINLCAPLPMFVSCTKSQAKEIWRNGATKEPANQKVNLIRPSLSRKNINHEGTKELKNEWIWR